MKFLNIYHLALTLMVFGSSTSATSAQLGHYLANSVMLDDKETFEKPDAKIDRINREKRDHSQSKSKHWCKIAYAGTPVQIMHEFDMNRIKVKITEGRCVNQVGFVRAIDIRTGS